MTEESLGRAVAVTALVPIAQRLADQREREEREAERQRQLEEALAAVPPLERPKEPGISPHLSLSERVPTMIGWTCGLFIPMFWIVNAVPALVHHHKNVGYANPLLALFFSGVLGVAIGGWRYWRVQYRIDRDRRVYEDRTSAVETREAEREAIRSTFETDA